MGPIALASGLCADSEAAEKKNGLAEEKKKLYTLPQMINKVP